MPQQTDLSVNSSNGKQSQHPLRELIHSLRDGVGFDVVLLLVPVAYLIIFSGLPLIYNVIMSFQEVDLFSLGSFVRPWVGLENYRSMINQPDFWPVMWNTVVFVAASISLQFGIGFSLALFFNQKFSGAGYIRGVFLVAFIMPGLVVGAVWNWIFAGDFGVLNHALSSLGIIEENIFWRSDPDFALSAIIIANVWLGVPFNMILLSVGLAAIPRDLYEAADIDGANSLQKFYTITLPMMRATIGAVVSLGTIFTLQQFDLIASITGGGPANSSNVAQYWAWQLSFKEFDFARGATVSAFMVVLVMGVAVIYIRSTKHEQKI